MATLPKSESNRYLTAEELLAIRGTPEFEAECRRQTKANAGWWRKHPEELLYLEALNAELWAILPEYASG